MQAVSQPVPAVVKRRVHHMRRRTARSGRLLAAAALAVVLFTASQVVLTRASGPQPPAAVHVVAEGETLWDIADQYSEGRDLREVVDLIQQYNGLQNAVIYPGQALEIPASISE